MTSSKPRSEVKEVQCTTGEQVDCVGPQSCGEITMAAASHDASHDESATQGSQSDAPKVSADERGCHSDGEAKPSIVTLVKLRGQSVEPGVPQVSYADKEKMCGSFF